MTRDNNHVPRHARYLDQVIPPNNRTPKVPPAFAHCDARLQELEARLLLSASGLDKQPISDLDDWLNRPVVQVDQTDLNGHDGLHGIVAPGDDHGNNAADSTFVQTDATLFGDIEIVADQDWFNFLGQAGIQYTFATELLGNSDTSLVLYDTDGVTVLASDDDGGPGLASLLNWTAPSQGTYYIAVRGFDTETGDYSISMSDTAIPTGEIRGTKWDDINADGIHDAGEPGLEGWIIFIDENRNRRREPSERFVVTDANGDYAFENMRPGTYTIAEKAKPGWEQTFPGPNGATFPNTPAIVGLGADVVSASTGGALPEEFVLFDDKWAQPGGLGSTVLITYSFSNLLDGGLPGGLSAAAIQTAIEEALDLWANFAPFKFVQMPDNGPAPDENHTAYPAASNPDIRFGYTDINDPNVLAHAFLPFQPATTGLSGDVHFSTGFTWSIGDGPGTFDLIEVAVHEIGHSLGLLHETAVDAIMNPVYGARYNGFGTSFLLDDDVDGIQALYGEVQSLLGVWSVTLANPGDIVTGIDFGSFLNDDHGNDQASAVPVGPPTLITGSIESFGDVDWFSFDAKQGQFFSFETLLDTGIEDTVIRLIGPDGTTLIGLDDDSGIALASKLPWVAPADGTYYLEVSGFNANVGDYTLRLAAAPQGDLDLDGFVGFNDLVIILDLFNQAVPVGVLLSGDPSFDGFVGIADLNIVLGNWNAGVQPPAVTQQASAGEALATDTPADSTPNQAADLAQTEQTQTAATVQSNSRVRPPRQARNSDSHRDRSRNKRADHDAPGHHAQDAVAAWSRKPSRTPLERPAVSFTYASDSDDSEGLLGLWSAAPED